MQDASKDLIKFSAYIRIIFRNKKALTALLCNRSRVRNNVTIPMAELVGILDSTHLGKKLHKILDIPGATTYYYSESSISLLQILRASSKRYRSLKVFVGNTCKKILDLVSNTCHIKFLPGKDDQQNKSDIVVTRAHLEQLDDGYFFGPKVFRDLLLPNCDHLLEDLRQNSSKMELFRNTIVSLPAKMITTKNDVLEPLLKLTHVPLKTQTIFERVCSLLL